MPKQSQCEATCRWLSKPEVREIQREKARVQFAEEPCKQKELQAPLSDASEGRASSPDGDDVSCDDISAKAPSSLSELRASIAGWQTEWGPATTWAKNFHQSLTRTQEKGRRAVDEFFSRCEDHVGEGRTILHNLRFLAHHPPNKGPKQVKDLYIQLDKYAPAVPFTKVSEVRCYSRI
ncbi:hypothetical protein DFJ58DRAFT_729711 [Suillus subalutaceus]|uniref:uncharacterized protein n=1 Tax=Suillus subalutaceus TaxID=48586 RepID=UPI001B86E7A4|nr:uncharacterized protein DFJ58DRAFT_729711 [Suillus subalutaceus]KAG1848952.1 hypothetical protein DFJ58DRAFT_729711 [Suillus subalutaceus]